MDVCCNCGSERNIVWHHVVPRSKGGKFIVPLCQICHDIVHGLNPRDISHSELTKQGLARAKAKGVKLGGPNCRFAWKKAATVIQQNKLAFAVKIFEIIRELQSSGIISLSKISETLNLRRIRTRRGGKWTVTAVMRIITICKGQETLRLAVIARQTRADIYAQKMIPILTKLKETNVMTLRGVAESLNTQGFKTPNGKMFAAQSVKNLIKRAF